MKFISIFTAALATLLATAAMAAAHTGKLLIKFPANVAQRAQQDPIKGFGQPVFGHLHLPAGAEAFSDLSTLPQMVAAPTSSPIQSDHSMLWVPQPEDAAGNPVSTSIHYYLMNSGYNLPGDMPNGLKIVGGNPEYVGAFASGQNITCLGTDGGSAAYNKHVIPSATQCPHGYELNVSSGQCWDGEHFGKGMGSDDGPVDAQSHITSASPSSCTGYPIPRIQVVEDVYGGSGGHLSSDKPNASGVIPYPGSTAHFDYVPGWLLDPMDGVPSIAKIIARCLNVDVFQGNLSCREVDSTTTGEGTVYVEKPTGGADFTQRVTG